MDPEDGGSQLELRDYLQVLARRKWIVVLVMVVALGTSVAAAQTQTPMYAATAELLLQPRSTETIFNPNTGQRNDPARAVQTEIRVLQSEPVRNKVKEKLGTDPTVSARPIGQTDVIEVRVESPKASLAAGAVMAYAQGYIDFRREQAVQDLFQAGEAIQAKLVELQGQIEAASPERRVSLEALQASFREELDKLQLNAELKSGGAQIVRSASVPDEPFAPKPLRTVLLSVVLGAIIGAGLAFLLEYLDDSIKSKEDLERATAGTGPMGQALTVLSIIPAVGGWRAKDEPLIVSLTEPSSPAAEAYRALRTSIQFLGVDRPVQSLQVTSPNAQEGKTTTLANLGVALARAGQPVVIICSDLRRPRVHEFFGLSNVVGFTSVLLGEVSLVGALQQVPGVDRLYVLASGPLPPNPSELLQTKRTAEVFKRLVDEGYFLLIDSPPTLPVADALVLAKRVDGTLLVCSAGATSRRELARAVELLHQVDAPVIGAVLNGVKAEASYGYYRSGYYGAEEASARSRNGGRAADVRNRVQKRVTRR